MEIDNYERWQSRETIDLNFENLLSRTGEPLLIIDFAQLRLNVPWQKKAFDIGSLCYRKRRPKHSNFNHPDNAVCLIDRDSIQQDRVKSIPKFLDFLLAKFSLGMRPNTLYRYTDAFQRYITWCDTNFENSLANLGAARDAFAYYISSLFEKVRTNQLNVNTAARYQNQVKDVLTYIFEDNNGQLTAGLRIIRKSFSATCVTSPPPKAEVAKCIGLYMAVFEQFTDFILKFEKYPFQVTLPEERLWVFPVAKSMASKDQLRVRNEWSHGFWAWDYENGCLTEPDAIEQYYGGGIKQKRDSARLIVKSAQKTLKDANTDPRYFFRRRHACIASDAFIMLFISNTAMNLAQLKQLPWSDGYSIEKEKHGYKTIKYRALNKEQQFIITSSFLPLFKKYLKLRKYLLEGKDAPLFFQMDLAIKKPNVVSNSFSMNYNKKLSHHFGLTVPKITAREWRAYKADWLVQKTDPSTAAALLQNSEKTILRHYTEGSESEGAEEITQYFELFNKIRYTLDSEEKAKYQKLPIGSCEDLAQPTPDDMSVGPKPDCISPAGCLFCKHYRVVADEVDIRKLLSYQFISRESLAISRDSEQYNDYLHPILARIEKILQAISAHEHNLEKLVKKISEEVRNEERLDSYWSAKYQMLINLELL